MLDLIVPRLAELATPSSNVSRDRLNDLEMQECVFLPVGLPTRMRRDTLPYQDADVRAHLADATGEGAEQRRHFLRIRVGGWEEEIVTTVFVRVHTQGDLLVLEVLPYVLPPLRAAFHQVDGLTERSTRLRPSVLSAAPAVTVAVLFSGLGAIRSWAREWWLSTDDVPVRAPRVSVRELGARDTWSIFQEMDINRYVRSIQDRITSGTHQPWPRPATRPTSSSSRWSTSAPAGCSSAVPWPDRSPRAPAHRRRPPRPNAPNRTTGDPT